MLIGPLGSRWPLPNAAWATPTIFCGIFTTTAAVCLRSDPRAPGTAESGWRTFAVPGLTPRKPTTSVRGVPSAPSTGSPFESVT